MRIEKDFEDLLKLFNRHEVKYCIIGAFALAFHAVPRFTKDLDMLVETGADNGKKIVEALNQFGFSSLSLTDGDFSKPGQVIQLGYEPLRIDILTSIKGLSFEEIWNSKIEAEYGETKTYFINLENLIKAKSISGRKQDLADLEVLMKFK